MMFCDQRKSNFGMTGCKSGVIIWRFRVARCSRTVTDSESLILDLQSRGLGSGLGTLDDRTLEVVLGQINTMKL